MTRTSPRTTNRADNHSQATSICYSLGRQFVEVAFAFIAPHDHAIHGDEFTAQPTFSTRCRLATQQRKIPGVVNLKHDRLSS